MSRGFSCPSCGHGNSRVIDSRPREVGPRTHSIEAFRRRRVCSSCEYRYTTFELLAEPVRKLERMLDMVELLNNGVNSHD